MVLSEQLQTPAQSASGKTSVAIGLATFQRPAKLAALLPHLLQQIDRIGADVCDDVVVLVVDNDPAGSARDAAHSTGDPRVRYVVEARPGISHARNRLLQEAADRDVLVFMDDDGVPRPRWFESLLQTYHSDDDINAVAGPAPAVFEDGSPDPWVEASGAYEDRRTHLKAGSYIRRAATGNLLVDMNRVRAYGLTFDERFGLTGGEDSMFTGEFTRAGGIIAWCPEAVVEDLIPHSRNNRSYVLRRVFATSSTTARVDLLLTDQGWSRVRGRVRWSLIAVGLTAQGSVLAFVGALRGNLRAQAHGERQVMSGLGAAAGCFGRSSAPYQRSPK